MQLSAVGYCWFNFSSAKDCLRNPIEAFQSDAWSRQILLTACGACAIWIHSLLPMIFGGKTSSDPSIVDKLWSIQPAVYAWHFHISNSSPRTFIMAVLATIWAARLTWNFVKKVHSEPTRYDDDTERLTHHPPTPREATAPAARITAGRKSASGSLVGSSKFSI